MKIQTTKDYKQGTMNLLVYGEPGSGKTTFASTAPGVLFIDIDKGLSSIDKEVDYLSVEKWDDIDLDEIEKSKYETIVVDTFTELQKLCQQHILDKNGLTVMRIQDWGVLQSMMVGFVRQLRNMNKNVICLCHIDPVKDETSGVIKYSPALQGKMQAQIPAYFDGVYYAFVKEVVEKDKPTAYVHKLLTRNTGKFIGKNRIGNLDTVERPDFVYIYNKTMKGKK